MNQPLAKVAIGSGLLALSIFLVACGGGGGGGAPAPTTINGINVPPEPDPVANDATVAGVDSNNNEVRDDVERFIAEEFGPEPELHSDMLAFARLEQAMLVTPPKSSSQGKQASSTSPKSASEQYSIGIGCMSNEQRAESEKVTAESLNTPERRRAYADALTGVLIVPSDDLREAGEC